MSLLLYTREVVWAKYQENKIIQALVRKMRVYFCLLIIFVSFLIIEVKVEARNLEEDAKIDEQAKIGLYS